MNIWLCPVKAKNWRIIKSVEIFGAPKQAAKTINEIQPGDLLIFYVFKPINGIVALCRAESKAFEDNKDIWGKGKYPLRVKIKIIKDLQDEGKKPIPLSSLFGITARQEEILIEPYLKNVWIVKISETQYYRMNNLFQR